MKTVTIFKLSVIAIIGSFLLLGCGGGDGNVCYGVNCSDTGNDNVSGGDGSGGNDDDTDGNNSNEITAVLDYYSLEKNITDSTSGLLYLREHPMTTDNIVHNTLENVYLKIITYHGIPSSVATQLYPYLTEGVYNPSECDEVWADPQTTNSLCGSFVIESLYISIPNINKGFVAFQEQDSINCGGETCDVSLGLFTNSADFNMTESETIPLTIFKSVFTDGANGIDRNNALKAIENSAQSVSIQINKFFINLNPLDYASVNSTIVSYIDQLKVNHPVPFEQNGENVIKTYQGAKYEIRNEFEADANITIRFFVTGSEINLGW
jgi:hypothetical protein